MTSRRERAERIIEGYARGHAGTAAIAGQLGGQFGADRIPLTALTVAMINELCDLYNVTDEGAKAVHIAAAIGRLTLRGTAIAQTILNWIPLIGPGANGVTTYFLTRQAGWECVHDIEEERMTVEAQTKKAVQSTISTVAGSTVGALSQDLSNEVVNSIVSQADQMNNCSGILADIIKDENLQTAEKRFLSSVVSRVSTQAISGTGVDIKEVLKQEIFDAIARQCFEEGIQISGNYVADKDEQLVARLKNLKEIYPEDFHRNIDTAIESYSNAISQEEKERAAREMLSLLKTGLDLIKVQ